MGTRNANSRKRAISWDTMVFVVRVVMVLDGWVGGTIVHVLGYHPLRKEFGAIKLATHCLHGLIRNLVFGGDPAIPSRIRSDETVTQMKRLLK